MQNNPQPPAPNWASTQEVSTNSSWLAPMILGAVIFATGCGGGLIAGWFAGVANSFGQNLLDYATAPFDADVVVSAPATAPADQPFEIAITVTDTSGNDRTVHDIDFDEFLNNAVRVVHIDPSPASTFADSTYREHSFDTLLPANQSKTFTFLVQATGTPSVEGNITVYLDDYASESHLVAVEISSSQPSDSTKQTQEGTDG